MNEFDRIAQIFRPLAQNPESLNLTDDTAWLQPPTGSSLVVTADALVAGVHFIGDEDPALIAQKALRVNLSDIASMGAEPYGYLLTTQLPRDLPVEWLMRFAEGLALDQQVFGLRLFGGDSTSTSGPMTLSVTMHGLLPEGAKPMRRNGAKVGDVLMVTGALGEAALGLTCFQARIENPYLQQRYLLPQPRVVFGQWLRDYASACMDVSDGLLQDAGHLARASKVAIAIDASALPGPVATEFDRQLCFDAALSGGDDYELLFAVPLVHVRAVLAHAASQNLSCKIIGAVDKGEGVTCMHLPTGVLLPKQSGWQHF